MLAIYTRLSREDEESTSIENQLQEGKEFAESHSFLGYQIYNEGEGASGTLDIEQRPVFKSLMDDIIAGKYSAVWFRNQNRVERNSFVFHLFLNACIKTKTRVYHADKEFDYNDPTQVLTNSILSNLNSYAAQLQGQQTKKVLLNRIRKGKAHGILPYGYTRDKDGFLIIDGEEAQIVKEIYTLSLKGHGYDTIAKLLNSREIPTRYNKIGQGTYKHTNKYTKEVTTFKKLHSQWTGTSVRSIIKNSLYKGERKWNGEIYKTYAIVKPDDWQKVNDNLKNNANNTGKKTHYKYLLKGLITCGICGRNMAGRINKGSGDAYYQCSSKRTESCGNRSINITKLNNLIWYRLFFGREILDKINKEFKTTTKNDKLEELQMERTLKNKELQSLNSEKQIAIKLVLKEYASEDDLKDNLSRINKTYKVLEEQIKLLDQQITFFENSTQIVEKYKNQFDRYTSNTTFQEKQEIINNIIDRIVSTSTETGYDVEIKFKIDIPSSLYKSRGWNIEEMDIPGNAAKIIPDKVFNNNNNGNSGTPPPNTTGNTPPPNSSDIGFKSTKTTNVTFHTTSDVALVGGGAYPQPGEISLSHNGVLFLDELPEFKRGVLEVLRQPLEDRQVTISRAKFTVTYPSSFMLVASMNPSPSGFFNDPGSPMTSSPAEMQRYLGRISGPLLDRIDIHIEVTPVPFEKLSEERNGESSIVIRKRVTSARHIQTLRFSENEKVHYNAQMSVKQIREYCQLEEPSKVLLKTAMERLNLSARAYDRILKVARTIADLEASEQIKGSHISEAIQYRSLDREGWLG